MNVRLAQVWAAIAARLTTPETTAILNGGRVYLDTEDYSAPPGPEGTPWGRQVIVPSTTLWPGLEISELYRGVSFLLRSEMNDYRGAGYNVQIPLEKLQDIGYTQLQRWEMPATAQARMTFAVYRQRPAQPMPEFDTEGSVWWMSSEYRFEAGRV